jgi:hypothetical protein
MKPYFTLDANNAVELAPDFDSWMTWVRKNHGRMEVAITAYPHCHIRTVFLGVESNGEETCPPSVFETVIIGGPHDAKTVTATSWEEAKANHAHVSELLAREALDAGGTCLSSPFQE